jgi:hypothetical protein
MVARKRYQLLACTLALVAVLGLLSITSRTKQDSVQEPKKGGWGSAEEAFAMASRRIKEYISSLGEGTPVIDCQFRTTLHSRSKIWTVKGHAYCANDHQSYRWTVILDYDGVKDWEILEKIVTPVFAAPVSGEVEGISQAQGELAQTAPRH